MRLIPLGCQRCRQAVSARLDGESTGVPDPEVVAHLQRCAACRAWEVDAAQVTRRLRVRPATASPDLSGRILVAASPTATRRMVGVALALVGVVQIALGVSQLLLDGFGHGTHGPIAVYWGQHLFDEGAAWNIAVGVAFVWAVRRPARANGLLAPLAVFVALVIVLSGRDLAVGTVPVSRVLSHIPTVLGVLLLAVLDRGHVDAPTPRSGEVLSVQSPQAYGTPASLLDISDDTRRSASGGDPQ